MYNQQFITGLKDQRASLIEQIHHIDAMLKLNGVSIGDDDLSLYGSNVSSNEMPYKKSDPWQRKLSALIKSSNRFLSINEVANMVCDFEPKISIEDAKRGLGSAKNSLLKAGSLVKFRVGSNNSNSFYGSPSWLKEDESIKEEYKYSEDALLVKPKIII